MFRQLVSLLIIFFTLTACVPAMPYPTPIASPAVAPSLTPAASATVALETAMAIPAPTVTPTAISTKTYHNTAVGFELDYPQGWVIDTSNEATGTVILWSRKVGGPGTDGVPADVVKIDIVNPAVAVQSLDELVAWEKQIIADTSHTVLQEQPVQLPNGLVAVHLHGSGMGEAMVLLTMINDQPLIVAGYGDLSRFMGVAQTLRPAPPTSQSSCCFPSQP